MPYSINLILSPQPLLGWLGYITGTLSLLLVFRWYGCTVNVRWRVLAVALLLPFVPLLVSVSVFWYAWYLPISTVLVLVCLLISGLCFRRVLRSAPLREHQPALAGRSAGIAPSWLPLVMLPVIALLIVSIRKSCEMAC